MIREFSRHVDTYGMISEFMLPTQASGNCLLFTAEMFACCRMNPQLASIQMHHFLTDALQGVLACEGRPGLFYRTPYGCSFHFDQEAIDDYIGLGAIAALAYPGIAKRILEYGRATKFKWKFLYLPYYFRTDVLPQTATNPDYADSAEAWFGRWPALIAHLQWAAGERPALWKRLYWAISLVIGPNAQSLDSWTLTWLMVIVAGDKGWIEKLATWIREKRLRRMYPGGMPQVFRLYFGFEHPIATYSERVVETT